MNKIILGDNQAIFRAGIAKVLVGQQDFRVIAQCSEMSRVTLTVDTYPSSIVVLASALEPDMADFMSRVKLAGSRAVVIAENDESAISYTARGVRGVVYRNTTGSALVDCVHKVIHGLICVQHPINAAQSENEDSVGARVRGRLTAKETKIVGLIAQGSKNREIAQRLGTTEQVIKNYLRSIYDKIGVSDRLELAIFTIHHKFLATAAAEAVKDIAPLPRDAGIANRLEVQLI
jgi:DNA-binding NarL/FixJ family response regulator